MHSPSASPPATAARPAPTPCVARSLAVRPLNQSALSCELVTIGICSLPSWPWRQNRPAPIAGFAACVLRPPPPPPLGRFPLPPFRYCALTTNRHPTAQLPNTTPFPCSDRPAPYPPLPCSRHRRRTPELLLFQQSLCSCLPPPSCCRLSRTSLPPSRGREPRRSPLSPLSRLFSSLPSLVFLLKLGSDTLNFA
ncbi:hypothetical protein NL676_015908 [Syzygium grande]|nr:hypothetical protein NL676_015908 [Syzygium grande]